MILGLSGKALSGKDTTADYLIEGFGWTKKVGFATNLKKACQDIFNLSESQVLTQEGKNALLEEPVVFSEKHLYCIIEWMRSTHDVAAAGKEYNHILGHTMYRPRDILQYVGTEVMRYYAPDYHAEVIFRSVKESEKIIITDVRFPNEADFILSSGGILVRVERPENLRASCGAVIDSSHPSEVSLDDWSQWSYVIYNNSRHLGDLYKSIDNMVNTLEI